MNNTNYIRTISGGVMMVHSVVADKKTELQQGNPQKKKKLSESTSQGKKLK